MPDRSPSTSPADGDGSDSLDFELTDLQSARAALDELPPGVGRLQSPASYWAPRRRRPEPTDRALAGATLEWLMSLPPSLRPRVLCDTIPRIANALAAVWSDPARREALFERLLEDHRDGKRRGFAYEVRRELERLRRG